jgi:predicted dithiol-disulfide oxidoreductase (DUF899 family)
MTATPPIVDHETCQEQIDAQRSGRMRTPARARDAIAEARRQLPMVEVDPATPVVGDRRRGPAHRHRPGAGRSCLRRGP